MIVVDASVVVDALRGVDHVIERLGTEWLLAPYLIDAEVGSALRRHVRAGDLTAKAAADALEDLADIEILRYEQTGLLDRAWQLRDNVSFYDALYIALAERQDVPLLTLDARMAVAPGIKAVVQVLPASP